MTYLFAFWIAMVQANQGYQLGYYGTVPIWFKEGECLQRNGNEFVSVPCKGVNEFTYIPIPHPDNMGILVNGDGTLWKEVNGVLVRVDETGKPKKDGAP